MNTPASFPPTQEDRHEAPVLTREHIEAAINSLQPVERVMIRLLLLQYLDPIDEDLIFMAQERAEPQMKAGSKFGGFAIAPDRSVLFPKEWIVATEYRVKQYASQVREHRHRLDLQISLIEDYLEGITQELEAIETLLKTECGHTQETLSELRALARQAAIGYALKKLAARTEKQAVEEAAYLNERLGLEYQAHSRRHDRFKKRLALAVQERHALMMSSLSDEHLATIWSIAKGPIMNRRVKAMQRYIGALAAVLKAPLAGTEFAAAVNAGLGSRSPGGSKNEGIATTPPVFKEDLWSKTVQTLPPGASPAEPKPCEHDGGAKVLLGRLRSLVTYQLGEEDENKLWLRTTQCLPCLIKARAVQQEAGVIGQAAEVVLERIQQRTALPRKQEAEPAPAPVAPSIPEKDLEELLRPFIGSDAGQEGAKSW
jgi:hypothetical protein